MASIPPDTDARLMEAAGQVFAEHGFQAATVREICERAGANIAAVNYHFRDKLGLYQAVFRHAAACGESTRDPGELSGPPQTRLRAWVEGFLRRLVAKDRAGWPGRLMAREMADPSPLLIEFIEQGARPDYERLLDIIRALHPGLNPEQLRRGAASVIGQVIFYHHARPFIERLAPDLRLDESVVDGLATHIVSFSLAGMARIATETAAVTAP